MTKVYVDTNIFLDAILNRVNLFGKDISKPALKFFEKSMACKYHLIISSWTLDELQNKIDPSSTIFFFKLIKHKIIKIQHTDEHIRLAKQRTEDNVDDAIHIVLAEEAKADFIVTRNIKHFNEIKTTIPLVKPEEL